MSENPNMSQRKIEMKGFDIENFCSFVMFTDESIMMDQSIDKMFTCIVTKTIFSQISSSPN